MRTGALRSAQGVWQLHGTATLSVPLATLIGRQLDLLPPTTTPLNTAFLSNVQVSPNSGDPTPDNNHSTIYNTVFGSFDPNCVLAFPARNGNPKDGGDILL